MFSLCFCILTVFQQLDIFIRRGSGDAAELSDREGASPSPTGWCEAVRFRRRGGRPRPPADMVECRTNGPPGASAPTGCRGRRPLRVRNHSMGARLREGQAPPLRGADVPGCGSDSGPPGASAPAGWCKSAHFCAFYVFYTFLLKTRKNAQIFVALRLTICYIEEIEASSAA